MPPPAPLPGAADDAASPPSWAAGCHEWGIDMGRPSLSRDHVAVTSSAKEDADAVPPPPPVDDDCWMVVGDDDVGDEDVWGLSEDDRGLDDDDDGRAASSTLSTCGCRW